jgi:hypothetical protein
MARTAPKGATWLIETLLNAFGTQMAAMTIRRVNAM